MATNVFVTLPTPSANGAGAGVDVSGMGATKTISVGSGGGVYTPTVAIQASMDNVNWSTVATFQGKSQKTVQVACHFLRSLVSNFVDGVGPSVGVGGDDSGVGFTTLSVLAGNGAAAGVGTSTTNPFKTVEVAGIFSGTVNVEVSEDGGVTYNAVMSFTRASVQSAIFAADHMRVVRSGVVATGPGTPTVIVSDGVLAGAGGGGGGGGATSSQELRYTAVGGESFFTQSWVTPRANVNFNARATGVGLANQMTFDCPTANYTTTSVLVNCSAPLMAGDVVAVSIVEITN